MYKLTVVAGPNRGTTYVLHEGKTSIGRQSANSIVLTSGQVSKIHCILTVNGKEIFLQDQGSSNGTFVNGVLTREQALAPGDRVSIGDFVLELSIPTRRSLRDAPALAQFSGQNPRSIPNSAAASHSFQSMSGAFSTPHQASVAPTDLKGKLFLAFEQYVMPVFYSLITKNEWNLILIGILSIFCLLNVIVSVAPMLQSNEQSIIQEAAKRAKFIARQIAETNAPYLAAKAETKTDIGLAARADSVRIAVLTELDGRVIAPAGKTGQYLIGGVEAKVSRALIDQYRTGKLKTGWAGGIDDTTVLGIWPVEIYDPATASSMIVAMAIVSIDISSAVLSAGDVGIIYSKSLIASGILFLLMGIVLYRVTLRPFQQLSEDMDHVLKGDLAQVTHEYRFKEVDSLWDMINVALQRIPKNSTATGNSMDSGPSIEDYLEPLKTLGEASHLGLVIFNPERQIVFMNELFEEMSRIRATEAVGQEISIVAPDQSVGQIFADLFERVSAGGMGIAEDVELSPGSSVKLHVAAFGKNGEAVKCYAATAVKNS